MSNLFYASLMDFQLRAALSPAFVAKFEQIAKMKSSTREETVQYFDQVLKNQASGNQKSSQKDASSLTIKNRRK